jgi:hypothetical protein
MTPEEKHARQAIDIPETAEERYYRIRDEIIERAGHDGRRLYRENTLFRQAVEAVVRGKDPWEVVALLVGCNIELEGKFRKLLMQWPSGEIPTL